MTVELLVGFKAENISVVAKPMTRATGLEAEQHDSLYVGDYYLFSMPERVIVKDNFVESTGDWEAEEFKKFGVLIGSTRPSVPSTSRRWPKTSALPPS